MKILSYMSNNAYVNIFLFSEFSYVFVRICWIDYAYLLLQTLECD